MYLASPFPEPIGKLPSCISLREGTSSECHISQANRTKHAVTSLCPNRSLTLGGVAPREVFPLPKAAVLRALQIGSTLGEAHLSLALVKWRYDWDWVSVQLGNSVTLKIFPSGSLNQATFAPVGVNPTLMLPRESSSGPPLLRACDW
jgi:hypothetical protein